MPPTPATNSRFRDMGGGHIAESIAHQVQVFYNPTTQAARVIFNAAPYILMGDTYQRIGMNQELLEQDLSSLLHLQLVPQGTIDPITGFDLSQVSMLGISIIHKMAFDFFHNVQAGTPGYPLLSTITGTSPTYQSANKLELPMRL